ncbi:MAG: LD-carboxypeptidase [Sphingomonadales bacterium]|nr:LD-carboxypeptidase [Sphingomonadales bacterium]
MRIAVVAPSCRLSEVAAAKVEAIVMARGDADLAIHSQCFLSDGHFAGSNAQRLAALRDVMADATVNAVWFARGGYGSNRIAEAALADLPDAAREKTYLGYSDAGFLLAGFHKAGLCVAHGPMVQDVIRAEGEAAVGRSLDWLVRRDEASLEPDLAGPAMAFNLTVLSSLLGTPLEPDFNGAELLVEDVAEHLYRIDRSMFHLARSASVARVRAIRLGRISDVPDNDPVWNGDAEAIVRDWCNRAGIRFGGSADIGHDACNRVVPFPLAAS